MTKNNNTELVVCGTHLTSPALCKQILCLLLLAAVLLTIPVTGDRAEAAQQFPVYPVIEPNIRFWEKIYGTFNSSQGVLHDKNNLDIIYAVVDLVAWNTPGSARINKQLIRLSRLRYKKMLSNLASGKKPVTREEKRIAALFKRGKHTSYRKARDNIRLQVGQKDRFRAGVIRSGAYMPSIKRILQSHGMPLELAYLPHVESSFNPKAHSKSAAVGLWQFTKYTGKGFMVINHDVDERRDAYVSSHAAAEFLKENHRQLGGWPEALTAYNYGRAGMVRAQRKWGSYDKIIQHHKTKIFRFASKNFYSEFVAALRVARRLEKDKSLIRDRPRATVTVRLKGFVAAKDLRRYFAVSKQDFARLNPALLNSVISGKKYVPRGYLLRLPGTKTIRQRAKTMPNRLFHSSQIRDRQYIVKKGDTASTIAGKYNISLKELSRLNNLDSRFKVRLRQKLKIPPGGAANRGNTGRVITLKATAKRKP